MKILQIDIADDCTTVNLLKATEFCPEEGEFFGI